MKKGFTLIELLIVIAIIAVLATAVTLILNPAELIKQGRDATRLSDLAAINSAIALYLVDVSNSGIGGVDNAACSTSSPFARCTDGILENFVTITGCTLSTSTTVDGTGWVTIDFQNISSGSPLSRIPIDPNNGSTNCGSGAEACFYAYGCNGTQYELNAAMESTRYRNNGTSDVESTDGGDVSNVYEIGNSPNLTCCDTLP